MSHRRQIMPDQVEMPCGHRVARIEREADTLPVSEITIQGPITATCERGHEWLVEEWTMRLNDRDIVRFGAQIR
jgi:hypothetical protein